MRVSEAGKGVFDDQGCNAKELRAHRAPLLAVKRDGELRTT